jgi:hypothetical protein
MIFGLRISPIVSQEIEIILFSAIAGEFTTAGWTYTL